MATLAQFSGPLAVGTVSVADGAPFPALVVPEGRVLDIAQAFGEPGLTVRDLLEDWERSLPRLEALAQDGAGEWVALADVRVHAPLEPRQIFQSGANYRKHVVDLAVAHEPADGRPAEQVREQTAAMMDRRATEDQPYMFIGLPSAVTGPYDDVVLPAWCEKPDWELELVAVIGKPAHRVPVEEALSHIAGYTIANDLTARELVFRRDMPEIGADWLRAKNAPGFTPLGPWIIPAASVGDPGSLQVTLELNGDTMQDESTKDMIFDVARLVSYASQTTPLLPGDLVLTGSPAGNGMHWGRLLRDGDVMQGTVTGLGTQRTRCVAEVPAP
ncbi:fumarylacetoacetate hydrolase family protein [Streptomyces sp. H39-S7]|uniref:fumarylacetoacetate hydrolase family protein n=1 Tax=Streptomyces sp. H39-S7 TaxID=3004357 RepID=UPI0022AFAFF8|nr:fumarylacetoacetate hydrolase family protein [Streptomyces sp. H39-S7]MCZ4122355.1 fumarylacetoacetate hydrolase family protein [Streptomyces sp. H39-S7]